MNGPIEKLLRGWINNCKHYEEMHSKSQTMYNTIDKILGALNIFLSSGGSLSTFATINTSAGEIVQIISGILLAICGIISGISIWLNAGKLSESHRKIATDFNALIIDMESYIVINKQNDNIDLIIKNFKDRMQQIIEESPTIPERFYSKLTENIEEVVKNDKVDVPIPIKRVQSIYKSEKAIDQEKKFMYELERMENHFKRENSIS